MTQYLLDANVFIQAKNLHYRFDFCQGFWAWIEAGYRQKIIFNTKMVFGELRKGSEADEARQWAEKMDAGFFLPDKQEPKAMEHYQALMKWAAGNKHYTQIAINDFAQSRNADPFLIAVAKSEGCTLVTHEKSRPESQKRIMIPDAAKYLHVECLDIYSLLSKHACNTFQFCLKK